MVVIVWQLDSELPIQSVPITTNVGSQNPAHDEVYLQPVGGFLRVLWFPTLIKIAAGDEGDNLVV